MTMENNQHSSNSFTLIFLESLTDFLFLKSLSNKQNFGDSIMIEMKQGRKIFDNMLAAVIAPNKLSQNQHKQLKNYLSEQGINFQQKSNKPQNLQNLNQFTRKIFGDRKYHLLKLDFNFTNYKIQVEKDLFGTNEDYLIQPFTKDYFLIINKKVEWFLQLPYDSQIICKNLYILGNTVTINLYKLYQTYGKQAPKNFNQLLEGINLTQNFLKNESMIQFSNKIIFYLKLKVQNCQGPKQMLRRIFQNGLQDSIDWRNIKTQKSLNSSDWDVFITRLRERQKQNFNEYKNQRKNISFNEIRYDFYIQKIPLQTNQVQENQTLTQYQHIVYTFKSKLQSKSQDIISLKYIWPGIVIFFQQIYLSWKTYERYFQEIIEKTIMLMEYKYYKYRFQIENRNEFFYLFEYLYPNFHYFIKTFNMLLRRSQRIQKSILSKDFQLQKSLQKLKFKLRIQENPLDLLMLDFLSKPNSISKGMDSISLKLVGFQNISLQRFFEWAVVCQMKVAQWQDVFNMITLNIKKIFSHQKYFLNISNIINYQYPYLNCLGCTNFFILNQSIPRSLFKTHIRLFPYCTLSKLKYEVLQQICSMLNNKGGIILFGIVKQYNGILPKGEFILNSDRNQNNKLVEQIISCIYPPVKLQRDIVISYVPIVKVEQSQDNKLVHITNLYSMRIKVCAKEQFRVFLWKDENNQFRTNFCVNRQNTSIDFYRKLNLSIKQRFKNYLDNKKKLKTNTTLNHICKEVMVFSNPIQDISAAFDFLSILFVKDIKINQLQSQVKKLNKNWHILVKFSQHKFSIAKYTAVLFHNDPIQDVIKHLTNNPQQKFDYKQVLPILVTKYLKIQSILTKKDILNANAWLKEQFPSEQLTYYVFKKYIEGGYQQVTQYYIATTNKKLSNLYMYYVFNHFKVKAIFKEPQQPEKLIEHIFGFQPRQYFFYNDNSVIEEPGKLQQQTNYDVKALQKYLKRQFNLQSFK